MTNIAPGAQLAHARHTRGYSEKDLFGRVAQCAMCGEVKQSKDTLPGFVYQPDSFADEYDCAADGAIPCEVEEL